MLKTVPGAAALLALVVYAPAAADTLVTGVIRDRTGAAVVGARVTAFDAGGRIIGEDAALADGTFAFGLSAAATAIAVACDYCEPVRRTVRDAPAPIVIIVQRFTALRRSGPSAADIAALPYRDAVDVASLEPFSVATAGRISDRGLGVYGATLVNGLPFYSAADGDNYSRLVPAHGVAAVDTTGPLLAPVYGSYASAGVYDLRLRDADTATSRLDAGNAFDFVGRAERANVDAEYAASTDVGNERRAAALDVSVPAAGGRFLVDVLDMNDRRARAAGASLAYLTDSRRYASAAVATATQSDDASLATFAARLRNRGPLSLEFGVRAARATSNVAGATAAQFDAAIYAQATRRSGGFTLAANLAADRGSNSGYGGSVLAAALVGSLGGDVALSPNWSAHSGIVSNLRIPTFSETAATAALPAPGLRSLLFEESIAYTDLHRLRIAGTAYAQRTTGTSTAHVNGIGVDAAWQIAPQLSVRTWLLRANELALAAYDARYAAGGVAAYPLTRQLVWFTYDNAVRLDALVRSGAVEGDIRVPLGAHYALALGSAKYAGKRVTTLGVTLR